MRIAVITTSYPSSADDAAGHFVRAEVRELERAGHSVRVIAAAAKGAKGAFGWPGAPARIVDRPWLVLDAARWVAAARLAIGAEKKLDRVICHWAVPSAWPIGVGAHAPVEVVSHGGDVRLLLGLPRTIRNGLVRRIAAHAEAWRFVSAELERSLLSAVDARAADAVRRIARVEASPIEMPDVAAAALRARQALGGAPLYVSVGRLVESKRVDLAIEHVARLTSARLVVVGDGPLRSDLERLARARGVDARFVGKVPRSEALAWIGAADALLLASRAEGRSTVLREAELLGVRVEHIRT